jgi:hypothetical protein
LAAHCCRKAFPLETDYFDYSLYFVAKFGAAIFDIFLTISESLYRGEMDNDFRSKWGSAFSFAAQMVLFGIQFYLEDAKRVNEEINILVAKGHRNSNQFALQLDPDVVVSLSITLG